MKALIGIVVILAASLAVMILGGASWSFGPVLLPLAAIAGVGWLAGVRLFAKGAPE